jgi:hypothetical protein
MTSLIFLMEYLFPLMKSFANVPNLGFEIVHNINIHNAHHDIILPNRRDQGIVNIARPSNPSQTTSSLFPMSLEKVQQLFWLYLGEKRRC